MEKILIEKVKQHEVLYNQVAPNYRDPNVRQEAWEEIGKELEITGKNICIHSYAKANLSSYNFDY